MKTLGLLKGQAGLLKKFILQGILLLLFALLLYLVFLLIGGKATAWIWAAGIVTALLIVILYAYLKSHFPKEKRQRSMVYKFFFSGIRIIIIITLLVGIWGVFEIISSADCGPCAVYQAIGLSLVIIWSCIFMAYFIWAIYYYNINLGIPEEVWDRINDAKEAKRTGNFYSEEDLAEEPHTNPYRSETFGLPNGTVRGMIAFTLLFGALAMLIVSIGMENQVDPNALFWDQYEFFKTAFLMMIAFYFGTRALQYLQSNSKPTDLSAGRNTGGGASSAQENTGNGGNAGNGESSSILDTLKDKVFDSMKPEIEENKESDNNPESDNKEDESIDLGDPMNPGKS